MANVLRKITHGWVTQEFNPVTGKVIGQEFFAGDIVEWEDLEGNREEPRDDLYHPFDMLQPTSQVSEVGKFTCSTCHKEKSIDEGVPSVYRGKGDDAEEICSPICMECAKICCEFDKEWGDYVLIEGRYQLKDGELSFPEMPIEPIATVPPFPIGEGI